MKKKKRLNLQNTWNYFQTGNKSEVTTAHLQPNRRAATTWHNLLLLLCEQPAVLLIFVNYRFQESYLLCHFKMISFFVMCYFQAISRRIIKLAIKIQSPLTFGNLSRETLFSNLNHLLITSYSEEFTIKLH